MYHLKRYFLIIIALVMQTVLSVNHAETKLHTVCIHIYTFFFNSKLFLFSALNLWLPHLTLNFLYHKCQSNTHNESIILSLLFSFLFKYFRIFLMCPPLRKILKVLRTQKNLPLKIYF